MSPTSHPQPTDCSAVRIRGSQPWLSKIAITQPGIPTYTIGGKRADRAVAVILVSWPARDQSGADATGGFYGARSSMHAAQNRSGQTPQPWGHLGVRRTGIRTGVLDRHPPAVF